MGEADYLRLGSWNARCARCGKKKKADELIQQWQGYWVCPEHWEVRQPQDFVRGIEERPTPPWVQNPADIFVSFCSLEGMTAVAGYAVAGCAVVGAVYLDITVVTP